MTPVRWMVLLSATSWLALIASTGGAFFLEFTAGMAAPLLVTIVSWSLVERTYRTRPERVTQILLTGFMIKAVFFGAYVVLMVRGLSVRPAPFALSLGGYFIALYAIQAEGCAPVVKAFHDGAETTSAWENPTTHAAGLRVPSPFAGRQMLKILRDSGGGAVAVGEDEIQDAQRLVARVEGIWTAPEAAALVAALIRLADERAVTRATEVVMVFTGAGIKYDPPKLAAPVDLAGSDAEIVEQVRRAVVR